MKTLLILSSLLALNSSAQAKLYVVHVNHVETIQPQHTVLNTLLQKDITIDTSAKTVKVRLSEACTTSNICPERLDFFTLELKKMGTVIQAEGMLPLQTKPLQTPGKAMMTMEKNVDNSTVITVKDQNGRSTLIASPMVETNILF